MLFRCSKVIKKHNRSDVCAATKSSDLWPFVPHFLGDLAPITCALRFINYNWTHRETQQRKILLQLCHAQANMIIGINALKPRYKIYRSPNFIYPNFKYFGELLSPSLHLFILIHHILNQPIASNPYLALGVFARFCTVINMLGCSAPSTPFLNSKTRDRSCSASSMRPC